MKNYTSIIKIASILILCFNVLITSAQVITNNGVTATISSGLVITGGALNNNSGSISNNGTFTLTDSLVNAGSMEGNGNWKIGGNWNNNGTFNAGTSLVNFNGIASQIIGGNAATTFNNLSLNNSNGLSLSLNAMVNGTLTFTNGKITTGSNILSMNNDAIVNGTGIGKYVFGNLSKGIPATNNQSKTFEVGDASVYAPVQIDFVGTPNGTGSLTVNTTSGQHPNINTSGLNPAKDVARYWTITNAGVTSFTSYNPTFNFVAGDIIGSANTANFHVANWNNSWSITTDGVRAATSTQGIGLTTFGDFAVGEICVTPVVNIINLSGTTVITCNTPSISLTATGGGNYLWDDGSTTADRTVTMAGTYSVTVTNPAGGCMTTGSITITNIPLPALATNNTNIQCFGNTTGTVTVTVTNLGGPFTYLWSPGNQTTHVATGLGAGNYSVVVTDTNGCSTTSNLIHVTQPSPLTLAGPTHFSFTNITCSGANDGIINVNPAGGVPPYSYTWSPSIATTATVSNLTPGTYSVTVTDQNGCTKFWGATIVQQPSPVQLAVTQTNVPGCNGDSTGIIRVIPTGGTPGYVYSWSPSIGTTATVSNLPAGSYAVTVTDNNGCTRFANTLITQPTAILISAPDHYSKTDLTCYGNNNGVIRINPAGGTPGYSYAWTPSQGNHATVSTLTAGAYTITISDAHGCTRVINSNILQPTQITFTDVVTNVSGCGPLGSIAVTATGGTGTKVYSKNNGTTFQGASFFSNLTASTYTIKVKDANGCMSNPIAIPISTNSIIAFTTTVVNATNCNASNGKIAVLASGGSGYYNYSKDSGITYQSSNIFYSLMHGIYKIRVKDVLVCYSNIGNVPVGPSCREGDMVASITTEFVSLKAYPIPADDHITVSFSSDKEGVYNIRLADVFGRIIINANNTSVAGDNQYQMDLSLIAKGVYFVILQQGEAVLQTKIVIQ